MSVTVTQQLTQQTVFVTGDPVENNVVVTVSNARGPAGTGGGSNSITSATTSDGTANLSLANVTTATAEVTGTLTAPHIHGNLAGSLYAHVRAGESLTKGDPVYVSGSHGSGASLIAIVSKADASNAAKMPAVGIMDADVLANATGHMVISGTISDLATNTYSINAELYVDSGGGLTATPPTARAQPVARVERSNLNNGAILVKVNGLSASDATGNTLVRRTSDGGASFTGLNSTELAVGGSILQASSLGNVSFGSGATVNFNALTYNYALGGAAALAHRTALGSGATGDQLFTAASVKVANEALGRITKIRTSDATGRTNNTFAADNQLTGFQLEANTVYRAEVRLRYTTGGGFGIKFQFSTPSLRYSSGDWGSGILAFPAATAQFQGVYNSGSNIIFGNSAFNVTGGYATGFFEFETGSTAGNAELQWAQNTTGATPTVLLTGSTITLIKRTP